MTGPEELRKAVADALQESELPRTLVAKDAGLGRATLESWMSGLRNPSAESVRQIAAALEKRAGRIQQIAARLRNLLSKDA
ncbi:MAG TPA: helix-turn-helix domain-containing protein [Longimicrobium sp.]|jgi:transcriptional regulator with XRE-family HTH domain|uniref:helix-turn-helix domain-containing protein n=1 Tax=Longimicrobium sp. TaxID=2029185 RepID=UPI002EDB03A0